MISEQKIKQDVKLTNFLEIIGVSVFFSCFLDVYFQHPGLFVLFYFFSSSFSCVSSLDASFIMKSIISSLFFGDPKIMSKKNK